MDPVAAFNLLEAVWWTAMAAVCWRKGRGEWKTVGRAATGWLLLFAVTEVIEFRTGAWWNPWWLAVIKAACVIGLVGCGIGVLRIRRRLSRST